MVVKESDLANKDAFVPDRHVLEKIPTHIYGLDDVLYGGFPAGRTVLVKGGTGSGKSLLGLGFLYHQAKDGKPGIYVTFEERAEAVRTNALTLGWDLGALEKAQKLSIIEAKVDAESITAGEFNLEGLLAIIAGKAKAIGAEFIVVDAIDVLMHTFRDAIRERAELLRLLNFLADRKTTAVLTMKEYKDTGASARYEFLDFMADCVIYLDQRVEFQISTRRLRVAKYRGSSFAGNEHPFVISNGGIRIVPVSSFELKHNALGGQFSTGIPGMDKVMGGGYRRSSCALITGLPGTGKTTMASLFVRAACERGEKVLYINFEQSPEALIAAMLSPGVDLRPALESGRLRFITNLPESMGAEKHLIEAVDMIDGFKPDHIVLDAVSSTIRMGSAQIAYEYMMRLLNYAKARGITAIFLNQLGSEQNLYEISGIGISSLVDTIVMLRYSESGGEVNRLLIVLKSRGSAHSNQYREFLITNNGIELADVFSGEGGALTGVARQEQEDREREAQKVRELEIEKREFLIARKKAALDAQLAETNAEIRMAELEVAALRKQEEKRQTGTEARAEMRGEKAKSARLGADRSGSQEAEG